MSAIELFEKYGLPISRGISLASFSAEIYSTIRKKNLQLSANEHLELFDYLWELGNSDRKEPLDRPGPELKIKLLSLRFVISEFYKIPIGEMEAHLIYMIEEKLDLSYAERSLLWAAFQATCPSMIARDLSDVNKVFRIKDVVEKYSQNGKKRIVVLDLGCGAGRAIHELVKNYPFVFGIGLDANIPTGHPDNVAFVKGNAESIPLANETCDIIYALAVIHYIPDRKKLTVFREIIRVLKPKGCFIFSEPYYAEKTIYQEFPNLLGCTLEKWGNHLKVVKN